jgi:dUTP pyrophosphatase
MVNLSAQAYTIHDGDRIAQAVLGPSTRANLTVVDTLDETVRGEGRFGHTG